MEMEMEMEMEAVEDIEMGEDITPPIPPLSWALHESCLNTHCSSCFSPLQNIIPQPHPHDHDGDAPSLLFCSLLCSSNYTRHCGPSTTTAAEAQLYLLRHCAPSTTDLRVALLLLLSLPSPSTPLQHLTRISGLLTNRDILMQDQETAARVRNGAKAISAAIIHNKEYYQAGVASSSSSLSLMEAVLCLVITNAVEVQDREGRSLGVAVYGPHFSWINHSCSPNAFYRFFVTPPPSTPPVWAQPCLRIMGTHNGGSKLQNVIELTGGCIGGYECGPRVVVRSIKRIKKGEKVTVAYTDLLQPKTIRQSELWAKYSFICCCTRCCVSPPSYIDHILEEIYASNLALSSSDSGNSFCREEANEWLTDYMDEVIAEYLSVGDPESCCAKLENILIHGILDWHLKTKEEKPKLNLRLHPLHHLALKAYTTLASAYKIRGSDLLTEHSRVEGDQFESFKTLRTSVAYHLFIASATNHFLCFESSLVVYVSNFLSGAGEALLTLARSPGWGSLGKPISNLASPAEYRCSKCSLLDGFGANLFPHRGQYADFENISSKIVDCINRLSEDVWSFLTQGCHCLMCKDLYAFSWLEKSPAIRDLDSYLGDNFTSFKPRSGDCIHRHKAHGDTNQRRITIFELGVHCLLYGGILSNVCYGPSSSFSSHIEDTLYVQK